MSELNDNQPPWLEEIVAYLDGELSAEESARVEQRLASDESYRRQLQSVERAWKALDELPQTVVDDRFSRTTMTMAVEAALAEVRELTQAMPVARRRRRWSTALAAAVAAALGFLVVRLAWQSPDAELRADLPVIDNVDVYTQFEGPEFLRMLSGDLDELGGDAGEISGRLARLASVSQPDSRDAWLRGLNAEEKTNLRAKLNRFRELPPQEQQRLRDLHAEIAAAADAESLKKAMMTYREWLGGLSPARQFELRNMPDQQRVRAVHEWARSMRDDALLALSDDELRQLMRQVRQSMDALPHPGPREPRPGDESRRGRPEPGRPPRGLGLQVAAAAARRGELQQAVLEALPERTRPAFEALAPQAKVARIMTWLRQAEALQGDVSQEALERFFAEELDAETRAELLSLPPGEMERALRWRYRRQTGQALGPWPVGPRGREELRGPGAPRWNDRPRPPGRRGEGFGPPGEFGPPPPDRREPPRRPPPGDAPPDDPPPEAAPAEAA